jgi:hypothetical protein
MPRFLAVALAAALAMTATLPARADDAAEFMQRFSGTWVGSGQLLFNTGGASEFACELSGDPSASQLTFGMSGKCWMGSLSAPVSASLRYNSDTNRFYGQFLDGAAGNGLDIVGNRAGRGFSLKLVRGSTQGRLAAETIGEDQMKITIYYRDIKNDRELPVVAMGFTRKDVITGSIQGN